MQITLTTPAVKNNQILFFKNIYGALFFFFSLTFELQNVACYES